MKIHVIEAASKLEKKKVAAYARVSTLNEEQEDSYETQVEYYSKKIKATDNWEYVKVYADKGISGSKARRRPGFIQMIEDAEKGMIDIILVKSISRFARNAAEAQEYVHYLKSLNVEVKFDREDISSFDPSADMIFGMLAALAQEEIKTLSSRVKWTNEKLLERGIRHVGSNHVFGYDEIEGKLIPNDKAWIVKEIFHCFAKGMSTAEIASHIYDMGARTLRTGKALSAGQVQNMLKNVIYVGDRHLQQAPPRNYLTHEPDYTQSYKSKYIENDHEAIIDREEWNKVQSIINKRKELREAGIYLRKGASPLYGKVFCEKCGSPYTRMTSHDKEGAHKRWMCKDRKKGKHGNGCRNPVIPEETLMEYVNGKDGKFIIKTDGSIVEN